MFEILFILSFVSLVRSIPIDNGVVGDPEIECGSTNIEINFNVQKPFEGHVYVKGLYDREGCRADGGTGQLSTGLRLPFDTQCNVIRSRSINPRGIFVTVIVIISFHPQFVTKVDRAYRIQCFFMEADKTVSNEIEVSELTTAFITQNAPMPICRYEILDGGPTGTPIQYAIVGQQIYHKWTCDTETIDAGNGGDKLEIIDLAGCALDKYLLNNLEYPTDLMAGQEAHVFKYADRSQLFFECQISVTIKQSNDVCLRPNCPEPQPFGAAIRANTRRGRGRRNAAIIDNSNIVDVNFDITTFDVSEKTMKSSNKLLEQSMIHHNQSIILQSYQPHRWSSLAGLNLPITMLLIISTFIITLVFSRYLYTKVLIDY